MPTSGSPSHKFELDPATILRAIWRRRKIFITGIFLGIAGPLLWFVSVTSEPLYLSKALISIEPSALAQIPFLRDPPRRDTIASHMVLLKSRSLSEAVIESLPKASIEELLVNSQYTDYWLLLTNRVKEWLGKPPTILTPHERALTELQRARMEFTPAKEAENVFVITATATQPRVAVDLVNTHIQVLLSRTRSVDHEDARRTRDFLELQYQQAKDGLARAEDTLSRLQQEKGRIRSGGAELDFVRLAQLEGALADTQASRQVLANRMESLQRSLGQAGLKEARESKDTRGKDKEDDQAAAAALAADNLARTNAFKGAQEQLAKLETRLSSLRERYTDAHPSVQATQEEVTRQQTRVAQLARQLPAAPAKAPNGGQVTPAPPSDRLELQTQLTALERESDALATKEETLKLQSARLRGNLRSLSQEEVQFGNLRRAVETNRNLVTVLSDKLMAARIREQGEPSVIRIVDPASPPAQPNATSTQKLALLIVAAAGAVAFGVAFGIEAWRQPVETETDVIKATDLPVLGSVGILHDVPKPLRRRLKRGQPLALFDQEKTIHMELYRAIRANIESERLKAPFRSILVTSPAPHEGKSTTILNLAYVFQEFGRRVLIVEADLRRPTLSPVLGVTNKPGIVDFLYGTAAFEQVCRPLASGVSIVPGQVARTDSASLLASARFKELINTATSHFDLVLIDSAPILAVSDNILLARVVDRTLLVARATTTSARDLTKAKMTVENAGGRLLGVILNHAHPRDVPYYHRRYRKYYPANNAAVVAPRPNSLGKSRPAEKK